jgi:hypothetical protein
MIFISPVFSRSGRPEFSSRLGQRVGGGAVRLTGVVTKHDDVTVALAARIGRVDVLERPGVLDPVPPSGNASPHGERAPV